MTHRRPYDRHTRSLSRLSWYALLCRPGAEKLTQDTLRLMGYTAIVPSREEFRGVNRYVREKRTKRYACMPRYVLIGFGDAPAWYDVLTLSMISGVLASNGFPAKIPYRQLAHLIAQDPDAIVKRARPEEAFMRTHHEFGLKQVVRIAGGSLEGFEFTVLGFDGAFATGEIEVFGKPAPVRIGLHELEPSEAA